MATISQIETKVLQKLGVLEADETADSNDTSLVNDKYDSVYGRLKALRLVSWGSADDIPTAAVVPVVGLVARECIEEFVVPVNVAQSLIMNEKRYLGMLKELEYDTYIDDGEPEYY